MPRAIVVTAGKDVAFVSCLVHRDGTSAGPVDFRLRTGLRKIDGDWVIVHEHHSLPPRKSGLLNRAANGHVEFQTCREGGAQAA